MINGVHNFISFVLGAEYVDDVQTKGNQSKGNGGSMSFCLRSHMLQLTNPVGRLFK